MNVNLSSELEAFVQRGVESGLYNNQSEVVREALRLLEEQGRLGDAHLVGRLRGALAESLVQADRGRLQDGREVIADVRASLRRRKRSNKKLPPWQRRRRSEAKCARLE